MVSRKQPESELENAPEALAGSLPQQFTDEQYRNVESFQDALNLVQSSMGAAIDASDLGNGFALLATDQKQQLVGVPFIIMDYTFNPSSKSKNGEFATAHVVTETGNKYILNDGSTGIYQQLKNLAQTGKVTGVLCKHGLRKSEYENEWTAEGVTYYIDTSA